MCHDTSISDRYVCTICMYVCLYVNKTNACMHSRLLVYVCTYVFMFMYITVYMYVCIVWFAIVSPKASSSFSFFWPLRREYADNVKQPRQTGTANKLVVNNQRRNLPDAVYGYQQWNIIKKNKFGIRQDRCVHT